jgi:hypothetical protein
MFRVAVSTASKPSTRCISEISLLVTNGMSHDPKPRIATAVPFLIRHPHGAGVVKARRLDEDVANRSAAPSEPVAFAPP